MTEPLWLIRAGTVGYRRAWAWQRELVARRAAGEIPDTVLLLEHPHVYTLGKRGSDADVLVPEALLAAQGAEVSTDRGGQVTYHGPGQLVGYPITLLERAPDLRLWVGKIQDALIGVAAGVRGRRPPGIRRRHRRLRRPGQAGRDRHARLPPGDQPRLRPQLRHRPHPLRRDRALRVLNAAVCSLSTLAGRPVTVAEALLVAERELAQSLGPRVRPCRPGYP